MTSSNGNIFRVTDPLCGEFTGPGEFPTERPVTRSFDVFFDLRPNKRLSKQWRGWWFETLSRPFWRHRNGLTPYRSILPWKDTVLWYAHEGALTRHFIKHKKPSETETSIPPGNIFTNMDGFKSQHRLVIACPDMCGMKFPIHSQTSTATPLGFVNWKGMSSHVL